jgi:hypothetical protein
LHIIVCIGKFLGVHLFFAIIFVQVGLWFFFNYRGISAKSNHGLRLLHGGLHHLHWLGIFLNGRRIKLVEKIVAVKIDVQFLSIQIRWLTLRFTQKQVAKILILHLGDFLGRTRTL